MIKNIVIGLLACAVVGLIIKSELDSEDRKDLELRLKNTELNLQYEKGVN